MNIIMDIILTWGIFMLVLLWIYKTKKSNQFYKNIPGPPTVPFLGNALDFKSTKELLNLFTKYTRDYGGIVKLQIGPFRKGLLITDYKFLEFLLSSTKLLKKSVDYKFLNPWLGTGLLTGDGPKWRLHRKILTPAFHFQILEKFMDVFERCGNRLVEKFEENVGQDSFEITKMISLCTLDIICETTMGITINAQNNEDVDYVRSVKQMCRIVFERAMSVIQRNDYLYRLTRNYFIQRKALRILHEQSNTVIQNKRIEPKITINDIDHEHFGSKSKKSFMDILLEAVVDGKPLPRDDIREEVDTFMFAGHDTTSTAIAFTLYCLAKHKEIQLKAYEEQQSIFAGKKMSPSYADLQRMKYLEQVIKESLRLYPPVPIYSREGSSDVFYDNKRLPDGDALIIFTYGVHRDPRHFTDPDSFIPERFQTVEGRLPFAYIPFSAGPRNCIGQKFAMLEMKSVISKILRKFELLPAFPEHELQLAAESVLTSLNGIKISLKLRRNK